MSELSIFIDESRDFGPYDFRSPYYIITMVFHDQSVDISGPIAKLNQDLANRGFPNHCVHTGPIIRRENEYEFESLQTRRRILNSMVTHPLYAKRLTDMLRSDGSVVFSSYEYDNRTTVFMTDENM